MTSLQAVLVRSVERAEACSRMNLNWMIKCGIETAQGQKAHDRLMANIDRLTRLATALGLGRVARPVSPADWLAAQVADNAPVSADAPAAPTQAWGDPDIEVEQDVAASGQTDAAPDIVEPDAVDVESADTPQVQPARTAPLSCIDDEPVDLGQRIAQSRRVRL